MLCAVFGANLGVGVDHVQGLLEFLKSLGAARIAAMAAVTVALVGFFAFLILRVTAPQMTPLFTDLTFEDSAAIVKDLEPRASPTSSRTRAPLCWCPRTACRGCA